MELSFAWFPLVAVLVPLFALYFFVKYVLHVHNKTGRLPKNPLFYILAIVCAVTFSSGLIRITNPEQQERVVHSFDVPTSHEELNIELQADKRYRPGDLNKNQTEME